MSHFDITEKSAQIVQLERVVTAFKPTVFVGSYREFKVIKSLYNERKETGEYHSPEFGH